jgi:hypothetical protein
MRHPRRAAVLPFGKLLCACALLAAAFPPPARASYEEFLTLDVAKQEEDDENLLDHVLVRQPIEWLDAWERSGSGFRSSQGCFTSGQWYLAHDLKVRVPMGDTTFLVIDTREVSDDESVYSWTQFDVRFPIHRLGLWGIRLRPTFDKSRHDVALLWDRGPSREGFTVQAAMGLEDAFNKFWSSRQVRVGDESEPYERHPYEPALRLGWNSAATRATAGGKWLTPSIKRIDAKDPSERRRVSLWGTKSDASLSQRIGDYTPEIQVEMLQASTYEYWEAVPGDHHVFRRRWRGEGALSRVIGEHGRLTLRYVYQERTQVWRPPIANNTLAVIDRMPMIEGAFQAPFHTYARVGFMRNRVTVTGLDRQPVSTEGTRLETRAFLGLQVRFGRVVLQGTECIELNREAYDVAFIHDKGFLHFQTTF